MRIRGTKRRLKAERSVMNDWDDRFLFFFQVLTFFFHCIILYIQNFAVVFAREAEGEVSVSA